MDDHPTELVEPELTKRPGDDDPIPDEKVTRRRPGQPTTPLTAPRAEALRILREAYGVCRLEVARGMLGEDVELHQYTSAQAVHLCLDRGCSWAQISEAMGVKRPTAFEWYQRHRDDPYPGDSAGG